MNKVLWFFITVIPSLVICYRLIDYLDVYFEPHNKNYLGAAIVMVGLPGALAICALLLVFYFMAIKKR
jgi:hypothetical protein